MEPVSSQIVPIFKEVSTPIELEQQDENLALIASLAGDERWEALQGEIDKDIAALEAMSGQINEKDTVEAIGFRWLAVRTTIAHLKSIKNMPDECLDAEKLDARKGE